MTLPTNVLKKKILIIRNAYPYDFGGGERMAVSLAHQLNQLGHQTTLVSRSPKVLNHARLKEISVIKGWWWSFQDWSGLLLLLFPIYLLWQLVLTVWYVSIIIRTRADVLHPQSRDDFIAVTIASMLLRKHVVWTDHADLKYVFLNFPVWYKNPLSKIVFSLSKRARAVILVSNNEKKHIEESLGRKAPPNYRVIYNGVESEILSPISRPKKDNDAVIFAATSRMVTAKGIGELIQAFNILTEKNTGLRLWLFGEGPEIDKFKILAANNKHVYFWGFPVNTLARLADADIFVHPSYHEGFSISLIEAAKVGLPIIACKTGGNPEIVTDGLNGLLVPVRGAEALAEAMEKLASNKSMREKMGKAGSNIYENNFVWEKLVKEKYMELYE